MNVQEIERQAARLHTNAKNGVMNHKGKRYELRFQSYEGIYSIIDDEGEELTRLNTRKVTTAKQWLREYLDN